ncbi:hypothetical protein KVR01_005896 [Diaporthe batatas]|uniref:uncharacterized protein n=1 Tax=Diaporthe batatas TaxID=748121 RepID=UPI001D054DAD|nr:uncharacterized protein KVR01_005896 [Diaporthe batatas]KAG8163978.1 hypothetical protein KVR01_005896 [Diaporthe batatas]
MAEKTEPKTASSPPPCKGTILVTGANGGLGRGYITALSRTPYAKAHRGIYLDRDDAAARDLDAFVKAKVQPRCPGHEYETAALDLGSLAKIRAFAADINARVANGSLGPIRALVLVAGYLDVAPEASKPRRFTEDGHEMVWGINYLANFLLVLLLLRSMDSEHGRVVMVSSWSHNPYDRRNAVTKHLGLPEYKVQYRDTEALSKGVEYPDDGQKAGLRRYGASKACLVMFMFELQRRLSVDPELSKISVLAMEPGAMVTNISNGAKMPSKTVTKVVVTLSKLTSAVAPNSPLRTPLKSGEHLLRATFDTRELGERPKAAYLDGGKRRKPGAEVQDEEKQKRLWGDTLTLVRLDPGETALQDLSV